MKIIRVPDDAINKPIYVSNRQGRPFIDHITETLEQAMRAYESNRSVKEMVDFCEKTIVQKEAGLVIRPSDAEIYRQIDKSPRRSPKIFKNGLRGARKIRFL